MNLRIPILLLGITGAALVADTDTKPAPRPRLTGAMVQEEAQKHPVRQLEKNNLEPVAAARDLTPYPVIGGGHGMVGRPEGPTPLTRPFDLVDGGTFEKFDGTYVSVEPKLQYDAPNAGWDFLKISW